MTGGVRFEIGSLLFDARPGELITRTQTKRLEPKAAAVLATLCLARGTVVSRQALLDRCWGEGEGSDEALTQAVAQIRRALEELGEGPDMVETLAKRGYRLRETKPDTSELHPSATQLLGEKASRKPRLMLVAGALALIVIAIWIAFPHGPRHFIRHALGWGPPSSGAPH